MMRILLIVLLFITSLSYADDQSTSLKSVSSYNNHLHKAFNVPRHRNTSKKVKTPKTQAQRKLNLVLPEDIMARVRKDDKTQQKERPEKVLPDLFETGLNEANLGISGGLIKSVDMKERGGVDGAKIQFEFKQ